MALSSDEGAIAGMAVIGGGAWGGPEDAGRHGFALRRQLRALHQYRTCVLIRKACLIASESPGASMPCEATDAATARILGQNAKTPPLGERARGDVGRRMVGCDRLCGKG